MFEKGFILTCSTKKASNVKVGDTITSATAYPSRIEQMNFHEGCVEVKYHNDFTGKNEVKRFKTDEDVYVIIKTKKK